MYLAIRQILLWVHPYYLYNYVFLSFQTEQFKVMQMGNVAFFPSSLRKTAKHIMIALLNMTAQIGIGVQQPLIIQMIENGDTV